MLDAGKSEDSTLSVEEEDVVSPPPALTAEEVIADCKNGTMLELKQVLNCGISPTDSKQTRSGLNK